MRVPKILVRMILMTALTSGVISVPLSSPSESVAYAATSTSQTKIVTPTLAQLRLSTQSAVENHRIRFSLEGSRIALGRHLASLRISYGDGSHFTLYSIRSEPSHVYRRPGAYRVQLELVDSAGHRSVATRTIVIGAPNHVEMARNASRLSASQIISFMPLSSTSERFTLARGIPRPVRGHVFLVGRGRLLPLGLIAVVLHASGNMDGTTIVVARDGSLANVYSDLSVVTSNGIGQTVTLTPRTHNSKLHFKSREVAASAVPFTCEMSSGGSPVNITADLTNTHINSTMYAPKLIFSFSLFFKPIFTLGVQFTGTANCQLADNSLITIPVPAVPGLFITAAPYMSLEATGAIGVNVTWDPTILLNIARAPGDNSTFFFFKSAASVTGGGSASLTVQGGMEVSASAARVVGLAISLGPELTATASISNLQACIAVNSDVELKAQIFANAFVDHVNVLLYDGHYFSSVLFHICSTASSPPTGSGASSPPQNVTNGGSGAPTNSPLPYFGPSTPETTSAVAATWSNYANAGGVAGPQIGADQTVGVVCRIIGIAVGSDQNDWWYLVGSSPWNAGYYVSADPFYNDGATSGVLHGTPLFDPNVPVCPNSAGSSSPPPPVGGSQSIVIGWSTVHPNWITMVLSGFSSGNYTYTCNFASGGNTSYTVAVTGNPETFDNAHTCLDGMGGDVVWVTIGSVTSNQITVGASSSPPPPVPTVAETPGPPVATRTFTDYLNAGGIIGPSILIGETVQVSCRAQGQAVSDGDTWWYKVASSPWNDTYWAPADNFYNDGATSGSLAGTPFFDPNVPMC